MGVPVSPRVGVPVSPARVRVPVSPGRFWVSTEGRCYSPQTGRSYLGTKPSKKKIARLCSEISGLTERRWGFIDTEEQVARINYKLQGWSNYFRIGPVAKPIEPWTDTRLTGCDSGYAASTRCRERGRHATRIDTCTRS